MTVISSRISNLPAEQREMLQIRLRSAAAAAKTCLHELIERQAAQTPSAIALTFGEEQVTYRELNARANQLAHYLRASGVGPEIVIGICAERTIEMVVGLIAILKAGGVYLPIDPAYPLERINFMLHDADIRLLLTQDALVQRLDLSDETPRFLLDTQWKELAEFPAKNLPKNVSNDNLAYVIYTSGSTGRPKGVAIEHHSAVTMVRWAHTVFPPETLTGVLASTSICFDLSVFELFVPLSCGGRIILAENALALPELPAKREVTLVNTVPSAAMELVRSNGIPESVRTVNLAGEALSRALVEQLYAREGIKQVYNLYGPSEDTTYSTYALIPQGEASAPSIGRPIAKTQAYVLDKEQELLPVGVAGELYIGGDGLARGYLQRPELTADRFVPNPFSTKPGARMYRTGDLVRYRADGELEYLGRIDHQVKIRGFRIELGEVEAALESDESVRECVVVAREDEPGQKRLVAYVVAEGDVDAATLRERLRVTLPDYMTPAAFVFMDRLPLSANGKVDRRALPSPDWSRLSQPLAFVPPRNSVESLLAKIWGDVLGLERVGVNDNFFDLGGDSILSIQIVSRAAAEGLRLTAKQLFQHQTIAALALSPELTAGGESSWAEQGVVTGPVALTPIQQWFFAQERVKPDHFNQSVMLRLRGDVEVDSLREAVAALVTHHDALRLRFSREAEHESTLINTDKKAVSTDEKFEIIRVNQWRQFNAAVDERSVVFAEVNLDSAAEVEEIAEEAQRSLSLSDGPLVRAVLMRVAGEEEPRLLLVIHHLAVDGVSWRILLEDLQTAYEQLQRSDAIRLPAKTSSFQQWAALLSERATSEEASYWTEQPWERAGRLPLDREGRNQRRDARQAMVELSKKETGWLLQEAPAAYRTGIQELLLTALAKVLGEWTGSEEVVVDLEGHGREETIADVTRTVGWFTTIYPVLLGGVSAQGRNGATAEIGERIKNIKEQLRAVPEGGLGYGLRRYLRGEVDEIKAEVLFNYLGQLDQVLGADGIITGVVSENSGASEDPSAERTHVLEINGAVTDGRLKLHWSYSGEQYESDTIERIAAQYQQELVQLIAHCREAGGRTPSDYPLAQLTQAQVDHVVGDGRAIEDIYPTTSLQQGLLFHALYAPSEGFYHQQVSCTIAGDFDTEIFVRAWHEVIERHAIFRTGFVWDGLSAPLQVVHRKALLPVDHLDWRELSSTEQSDRWETLRTGDRAHGFDLGQASLMRLAIARVADDRYRLLWSHHHLLLDGWCLALVLKEVFDAYDRERGVTGTMPVASRPYRDYIAWLQQQDLAKAENYWRETLRGFVEPTTPSLRARKDHAEELPGKHHVQLTSVRTQRLQELARREQVTMNTVLQGAWALLLSRYCGANDVVFGATVSGRPAELSGVEQMIGLFINTLPVRVQVKEDEAVWNWLRRLQEQQLEMRQFEYSPLAQVQQWSEMPAGVPLFETLLAYENYPVQKSMQTGERDGLRIKDVDVWERSNYPLTVVVMPGDELSIEVRYERDQFDDESIERLTMHLLTILEEIGAKEQLSQIEMLGANDRRQLLEEWNTTTTTQPRCITEWFEAQVELTPTAVAVVYEQEQLTYSELNARANQLAHCLRASGVGPDVVVGICVERSLELVVGVLGILKAGGAYLPLDPLYPAERIAFMLEDAQARMLLTQRELAERIAVDTNIPRLSLDADWDQFATNPTDNLRVEVSPANLAYIIYTSGSTGRPKGVMIAHEQVTRLFQSTEAWFAFNEHDVWTLFHSFAFDFSVWELWGALLYGGRLVVVPYFVSRSPEGFYELLCAQRVTVLNQTPSAFQRLQEVDAHATVKSGLRLIIFGGEALQFQSLRPGFQGEHRPQYVNMYGITETTVHVTYYPLSESELGAETASVIGQRIPDLQLYVLDQGQRLAPVGVVGELYVGGAGLARGYVGRGELTAERFVPHPYGRAGGERLYRTGDLGRYLANGDLEYLGRADEQVKIRGFRIELGEIEAVLAMHEGVRECVVIAREDEPGHKRLVAYVTGAVDVAALREHARVSLPEYMVPAAFVFMDQLPLTANGKLDRRSLPLPDWTLLAQPLEFTPPRNAVEAELARVWAEVLGVERVGVNDNFFDLGGDSILSIQIIARAAAAGLKVTAKQLFQHQTIAALALSPELTAGGESSWAEQGVVTGPVALTPIQQWFFAQERVKPDHFNQSVMLRLRGDVEVDSLREAVAALVTHHDALRLRFSREAEHESTLINTDKKAVSTDEKFEIIRVNQWRQFNAAVDERSVVFAEVNLDSAAEIERVAEDVQRSLSLSDGPLVRAVLMRVAGEEEPRLLLVIHHLAVDGVSWRILLEDLQTAYEQLRRGEVVKLPAKTSSFQQWAALLSERAANEEVKYWTEQPWERAGRLPVDREGRNQRRDARQAIVELSKKETGWLLQEAPAAYRTGIQELLLTALAKVLGEWTGSEEVVVDLEGHGREETIADVTRTVGWFTTIYPVLLGGVSAQGRNGATEEIGALIKRVKEQLRTVTDGGLGYGVRRYLRGEVDEIKAEVLFNYLGQLDQALGRDVDGLIVGAVNERSGASEDPEAARQYLLEINGAVTEGQLQLRWSYSGEQYESDTIERIAAQYQQELVQLIAHCREAGGRTPSDYPLARLTQAQVDHVAGNGRAIEDIYPATPLQQGLLFHALYAPSAGFYHQQVSCVLGGGFEPELFVRAWHEVIARHAIFRTGFVWEGLASPLQVVYREAQLPVAEHDWRELSATEQAEHWEQLRVADRARAFELDQASLMRLALARVSESDYRLLWSHHHLLLDGWCLALVMREVFEAYDRQRGVPGATERTAGRPYRDYIAWLQQQDLEKAEAYWRETLRGFVEPTLILDRNGRGQLDHGQNEQGQHWVRLTSAQTQRLQERARREQVTMNTVLQGAWALLLSRYSGTSDVVFGTTVSGRPATVAGVEEMIGLFINTLPVRVEVKDSQSVWAWLRELQEQQVEMRQYEYSPLAQVQQWSEVTGGRALFETLLAYENYPVEKSMQAGGSLEVKDVDVWERSNYPLAVVVMPGDELAIELTYERNRFDDESIERLGLHLLTILEEIETREAVEAIDMLGAGERRQLLEEWNTTTTDYPRDHCIHELFEEQVARTPDAVAAVFEQTQLKYRELNARANQLARRLIELGVRPGVRVGVFMKHSLEEIATLLAIVKAGGAYVPLEPAHPAARVAFIIKDAQLALVLTQQEMASKLPDGDVAVVCIDRDDQPTDETNLQPIATPADIVYVIYTSGSTGQPKGVTISHRALINYAWWAKDAYLQNEPLGFALYSSLAFDLTVTSIYVPLISGNRIVIHTWEGDETRKEAPLAKILGDGQTGVLKLTPSHLSLIKDWDNRDSNVKRLIVGGEALTTELAQQVHESFGGKVEIYNEYGPTEATVGCMIHKYDAQRDTRLDVPIGRAAANVQIYSLDHSLQPTAANVTGELYIAGDGLAQGYLNRPELTAERFVANPFKPGTRMYRSGDLCRWLPNGVLEYLGRQDEQIKFHGYRVELNEIRSALKQHPLVRDSVIVITQHKTGHDVMVAYYVSRQELDARELRTFLSKLLIAETIPNIFVHLHRIPLTVNGKVNHEALPSLEEAKQKLKRTFTPAGTPPEEIMVGIWAEVLGLERVGIDDNFFDLGGHSLLATQLISRVREAFQVELALRTLFEKPTVAALAKAIEEKLHAGQQMDVPAIDPSRRNGRLPLSFAQQRLWFLDQLEPNSAFYNSALAMRLHGELKKEALDFTLTEIVRRHEVLRTTFKAVDGEPLQVVHPATTQKVSLIDLGALCSEIGDAELQRLKTEEAAGAFDLAHGPLLRVKLLRTSATEHVVLLTMHHIISDAWSMGVFVNEVAMLYRSYCEGRESPLPEIEVQYADFALWQRHWLQGDALERELNYWKQQLAGAPPALELPTDRPRPLVQTYNGKQRSFALPATLVDSLKRLSQKHGVTLFMSMLAAFKVLLQRYTGQEDLIVGAANAGRSRREIEHVIGFFINTLVLRTNLAGDPAFTEFLRSVREVCLEAYTHQDVPFDKLVEELQFERDASRPPVFQVAFGLQNAPAGKLELPGLELEPMISESEASRYELTLWISETPSSLTALWTYNTDLFDESTIKRMHGHYETLLESIVIDPDARVSSLEMLTEAERRERDRQEEQHEAAALSKLMRARRRSIALTP